MWEESEWGSPTQPSTRFVQVLGGSPSVPPSSSSPPPATHRATQSQSSLKCRESFTTGFLINLPTYLLTAYLLTSLEGRDLGEVPLRQQQERGPFRLGGWTPRVTGGKGVVPYVTHVVTSRWERADRGCCLTLENLPSLTQDGERSRGRNGSGSIHNHPQTTRHLLTHLRTHGS